MATSAKVPAAIACGLICLMVGIAGGAAGMVGFGYRVDPPPTRPAEGGMSSMSSMPGGGGGGGPGGGAGGPGGGRGGPSPKAQLAGLVTKLNQLTAGSLHVDLTPDQKAKVREQIQGLSDKAELSDEDAKKRLDTLLEVLKDNKETMEAAGYRWPGAGGPVAGRPAEPPVNPFTEEAGSKALSSLEAHLGKG